MAKTVEKDKGLNIKISQASPCQHRLKVNMNAASSSPIREEIIHEFQKEAALPGKLMKFFLRMPGWRNWQTHRT